MYVQHPLQFPNRPPHGSAPRKWSSGLFSCFDDPSTCCITYCCPCITFGQVAEIVDRGGTLCALGAIVYTILASFGCACLYLFTYRSKIRSLYALKEDPSADFLVHCCCDPCAICQEYRELKNFGVDPSIGFITCCCPCVTFGQVSEIVDRGGTSCAVAGIIFAVLIHFGCPCLFSCTYRTKLRALYTLKEDPCNDFLVHCCYGPCAICQEYRELKNFGADPAIGWTANVENWNRGAKTEPPPVYPGMNR